MISRAPTEVDVEDLDLDAELDKILGGSPKARRQTGTRSNSAFLSTQGSGSFKFAPSSRPAILEPADTGLPEKESLRKEAPRISSPKASPVTAAGTPSSPGGLVDALLNDLCADLGVTDGGNAADQVRSEVFEPPSQPSDSEQASPSEFSDGEDNDGLAMPPVASLTSLKLLDSKENSYINGSVPELPKPKLPWSAEESGRLRRVVKKVVKNGTRDKEQLWTEVSSQMGDRDPRDCKLQYARDYKADKAKKAQELPGELP